MSAVGTGRASRAAGRGDRRRSTTSTHAVTAVVVSHNAAPYLRRTLSALRAQHGIRLQVVVVDSASSDDSCDLVRLEFPEVELVASERNLGLAGGANRGIERARHPLVCTMNEDVELAPDALSILAEYMAANPKVGAVGPQLRNSDGTLQPSGAPLPGIADVIAARYHLPFARARGRRWTRARDFDTGCTVGVIPGACLMVTRSALDEVGPYDDASFFVNWEDVDWCHRIAAAGYEVRYVPTAQAIHHLGVSTATNAAMVSLSGRTGALRYFAKHRGRLAAWAIAAALLPGDLLSLLTHSILDLLSGGRRDRGRLARSILAATWRLGRRPVGTNGAPDRRRFKRAFKPAVQGILRLPGALALAEAATRQLGRRWPDSELAIAPRFQIVESLLTRGHDTTRRTRLPGGAELIVDLADYWGRKVYFCSNQTLDRGWVYESETTRFISGSLRPGDTFVDIGANVGFFAVLAASIVGPSGRVHAFEPNPVAHELLARSAAAEDLHGRLVVNRLAVAAVTGSTRLWRRPDLKAGDDASTIRRRGWIPIEVAATTIDDYCRANGIEGARLVKIDVEGAELDVLAGAAHLLGAIRPDAVVCEFAPILLADPKRSWARLLAAFSAHGYSLRWLDQSGTPQHPKQCDMPSWDWGNVCFIPSVRTNSTARPHGNGVV